MTSKTPTRPGYPWRTALFGALVIIVLPWFFMLLDGEGSTAWAMVQLVVVNPVVFVVGVVRSWFRYGWKWVVVLCAFAAAFLISVFTVYNASALGYLVGYVALSVVVVAVVMAVRVLTSHRTLDQD